MDQGNGKNLTAGWSAPPPGLHWQEWGAEFFGTALLLLGGLSGLFLSFSPGGAVAHATDNESVRLLATGAMLAGHDLGEHCRMLGSGRRHVVGGLLSLSASWPHGVTSHHVRAWKP